MSYKYSIIIPHKNIPHLLQRCLSSIPAKEDIQIIVVDDSSDNIDDIRLVVNAYNNVELILSNESKGAGNARNCGLEIAKGKWILFADADDFFSQSIYELIDDHYNDDADIVYFAADSVYSETLKPSSKLNARKRSLMRYSCNPRKLNDFCKYFQTEPWGKMVKRELIEEHHVRFDETPLANDYYFSVVTGYYAKKIVFDNRVIYIYTEREGSLSYNYSTNIETLSTRLGVYLRVQKFYDEHGIPYVPFYRYSLSESLKGNNDFSSVIKEFWKSNSISIMYVLYRYVRGKIYQYTFGVNL